MTQANVKCPNCNERHTYEIPGPAPLIRKGMGERKIKEVELQCKNSKCGKKFKIQVPA